MLLVNFEKVLMVHDVVHYSVLANGNILRQCTNHSNTFVEQLQHTKSIKYTQSAQDKRTKRIKEFVVVLYFYSTFAYLPLVPNI